MHPETYPDRILFAESRHLEAFVDFWRRRVDIEKAYLDNLSELWIPDQLGNGQLQKLAQKTRKLLLDELAVRRRGFAKLNAACKTLTDEFWTEEGPNHFDIWGGAMNQSLLRMDSLTAEVATAEALAERLAAEAREKENFFMSSSPKQENQPRLNVLSRLLDKGRNEQPYDTSSFLSADSTYRQKVQKLNDEKYRIQHETAQQTERFAEHDEKCVVALKHVVSVFSDAHSDLVQVLNGTSSQLRNVASSVDASMESASLAERLDESFISLTQPHRDLDDASIGQRAVSKAFEAILSSAAKIHPNSLYKAICDAHKQQGDDIKLSALRLESLWDPSQLDGGMEAVDYLINAPSVGLLVYFLTRLPEPFLPLQESDIKRIAKPGACVFRDMIRATAEAGNRMGTARRCNLARLFLTLGRQPSSVYQLAESNPEGVQILIRTSGRLLHSGLESRFGQVIDQAGGLINGGWGHGLVLPDDFIKELKGAGLYS